MMEFEVPKIFRNTAGSVRGIRSALALDAVIFLLTPEVKGQTLLEGQRALQLADVRQEASLSRDCDQLAPVLHQNRLCIKIDIVVVVKDELSVVHNVYVMECIDEWTLLVGVSGYIALTNHEQIGHVVVFDISEGLEHLGPICTAGFRFSGMTNDIEYQ